MSLPEGWGVGFPYQDVWERRFPWPSAGHLPAAAIGLNGAIGWLGNPHGLFLTNAQLAPVVKYRRVYRENLPPRRGHFHRALVKLDVVFDFRGHASIIGDLSCQTVS